MLGRIDFQQKVDTVDAKSKGIIHKAKLAGFIYDLVESKCNAIDNKIKQIRIKNNFMKDEAIECTNNECKIRFQEMADEVAGLSQKIESLNMKIEEVEKKVDNMSKRGTRKVKLKSD